MFWLATVKTSFNGKSRSESALVSDPEPETRKEGRAGSSNANLGRWLKILFGVIFSYFLLWFLPGMALTYLSYVPSHEWLQAIEPYRMILGAIAVVITAGFLFLSFQVGHLQRAQRDNNSTILVVPITIAFMIYISSVELLRCVVPAMIAIAWGERVEHRFFVLDPDEPGGFRGRCRREIVLRDMGMFTILCNMPSEFHDQLQPRTYVVFIGKGTWMGLFVEDFRKP